MKWPKLIALSLFSFLSLGQPQSQVVFEWNEAEQGSGDTLRAVLTTRNFQDIASFQYTFTWDTTLLRPLGDALPGLDNLLINLLSGKMAFSWFSTGGITVSLEDYFVIAEVDFLAVNCRDAELRLSLAEDVFPLPEAHGSNGDRITIEAIGGRYGLFSPELILADTLFLCEGAEGTLTGQNCPDCDWQWNTGQTTLSVPIIGDAWYGVIATSGAGCIFLDSVRTEYIPSAPLSLPADTVFCAGDSIQLSAPEAGASYLWSTGDTTSALWLKSGGRYALTVTEENGCVRRGATQASLRAPPAAGLFADPETICLGDTLALIPSGGYYYELLDSTGRMFAEDSVHFSITPRQTARWQAVAFGKCGRDTAEVQVTVISPKGSAGRDTCIGKGESLELAASGGAYYRWLPGEYDVSDPNISNPLTTPTDSAFYIVEISDTNGCRLIDSVLVAVADTPEAFLKPVNLLTPNGDGLNDAFEIAQLEKFAHNKLMIFNRWGKLLYEKENYQKDEERWKGTYQEKTLPAGMYFYVLEVNDFVFKQSLMILKNNE